MEQEGYATFNNISVTSWQSVLLVEESGVSGENHQPAASLHLDVTEYTSSSSKTNNIATM